MRRLSCAVQIILLLAGITSCRKEMVDEDAQVQTTDIILSAGHDGFGKVVLDSGLCPKWTGDDSLAVFDGHGRAPFIVSTTDGTNAEFGGKVASDATDLVAVYPYASGLNCVNGKVTVEFPQVQYIEPGDSSSSAALICVAKTTMAAKQLHFRNVYALLKVDIDLDGVTSLRIVGKNGEILSGRGTVDAVTSLQFEPTEGQNSVTVLPKNGTFSKGSYYVAIPPVEFSAGFSVEMGRSDGMMAVKTTDKQLVAVRNRGVDLASVTFKTKWKIGIHNAEELLAWNASDANRTDDDEVELLADIDMGGAEWTPTNLKGLFEGNGHKVYNMNVKNVQYCGFFATVSGTVRNLVVGSSDYDGTSGKWDGTTAFRHETTTITGWSYVGGIAARLNNDATISGCVNFAPVEVGAADNQKSCIGGIVGFCSSAKGGMKVEECINYGEVRNLATSSSVSNNCMGGITSKCEGETVIKGCVNRGKVTCSNPGVCWVGGIIGVGNGRLASALTDNVDYDANIVSCTNYADIVVNDGAKPTVGGIIGDLVSSNVDGCTNVGKLSSWAPSELKIGGVAGKFEMGRPSSLRNCVNGMSGDSSKGGIISDSGTASAFVGGILGNIPAAATGTLTISGCVNYADITTDNPYAGNIGGFGGTWNATGCVVTLSGCENHGDVINTSSNVDAGDNKAGGFVGSFNNGSGNVSSFTACTNHGAVTVSKARKASGQIGGFCGTASYINFDSCENKGNVTFSNELAAGNAMNVGGIVGYASNQVNMKDCSNSGNVRIGASAVTGNGLAGGIAGNIVSSTLDNCDNSGTICVLDGYKGNVYVGGIAGYSNGVTIRNGSDNSGNVYAACQTNVYVGGILGSFVTSRITIDGSKNTGTVYANKKSGQFLVGGIMGDGASLAAVVSNCVNEGTVYATQTGYSKQYFTVGGIVGRSKGKSGALHEVTGCVNRGTVTVTANTDNQLCNAGGIVGETNTYSVVTGNVNEASGKVSCTNNISLTYSVRTAYAGGISGGDNESTVGAVGNDTVTDNVNYADVSACVTSNATAIGAGGVFGMLQRTGVFTDNKVLGSCSISSTGGLTVGGAGAVMGYIAAPQVITGITAQVSKGTVVNENGYDAVKDMPGRLSAWLLPGNNGNVSATFVEVN